MTANKASSRTRDREKSLILAGAGGGTAICCALASCWGSFSSMVTPFGLVARYRKIEHSVESATRKGSLRWGGRGRPKESLNRCQARTKKRKASRKDQSRKSSRLPARDQAFAVLALIKNPTAAIAIAPTTAPVNVSITKTSAALGSFMLPLPVTTVSATV